MQHCLRVPSGKWWAWLSWGFPSRDVGSERRAAAPSGAGRRGRGGGGGGRLRGGRIRRHQPHVGPDQLLPGSPGGEKRSPEHPAEGAVGIESASPPGVPAAATTRRGWGTSKSPAGSLRIENQLFRDFF